MSASAAVDAAVSKARLLAQLDDPVWWADNNICMKASEAGVGDRVVWVDFGRYSSDVHIYEITKVARKWRTVVGIEGRWPREDRFFINEHFGGVAQLDPGDGRGYSGRFVYGAIDWEVKRAEETAMEEIKASGLRFEYAHGKGWSPVKRIQLAGFLREIGMVPE